MSLDQFCNKCGVFQSAVCPNCRDGNGSKITIEKKAYVEVGVVTAHPIVFAWKQIKTVFRSWMFARKNGLPIDKWYGVYEVGSELVHAHTGCMPQSKLRAELLCDAENNFRNTNTAKI